MNRNWKTSLLVGLTAILTTNASAFAQNGYYGGACEPAACAPSCDVPTCDVPTCDVPSCAPTCGYGCGECDYGYGGGCCDPCCLNVVAILDGALDVATTPFRWVASALTDGIYPDCGCAARPPKSDCNPCDICGNYVGGCGDYCEGSVCGAGCATGCGTNYASNYYSGNAGGGYDGGAYSVGAYDAETYDSSPTRVPGNVGPNSNRGSRSIPSNAAPAAPAGPAVSPEVLPPEAIEQGGYSAVPKRKLQFGARKPFSFASLVDGSRNSGAVRQVSYQERQILNDLAADARAERAAATQNVRTKKSVVRDGRYGQYGAPNQIAAQEFDSQDFVPQANVVYVERPVYLDQNGRPIDPSRLQVQNVEPRPVRQVQYVEPARQAAPVYVENVRADDSQFERAGKTFGQTKPIR